MIIYHQSKEPFSSVGTYEQMIERQMPLPDAADGGKYNYSVDTTSMHPDDYASSDEVTGFPEYDIHSGRAMHVPSTLDDIFNKKPSAAHEKIAKTTETADVQPYDMSIFYKDMYENAIEPKLKQVHHNKDKIEGFESIEGFNILDKNLDVAQHTKCTVDETEQDADTYIREKLLSGNDACDLDKTYSITERANYRDKFFSFRNDVWQTSKDVDMVDKIADMYLSGNEDVARGYGRGREIKDLFNDLTQYNEGLTIPKEMNIESDKLTGSPFNRVMNQGEKLVVGHNNAKGMSDAQWTYENDKTMNGGKFYDDIEPHTGKCSLSQAIQI